MVDPIWSFTGGMGKNVKSRHRFVVTGYDVHSGRQAVVSNSLRVGEAVHGRNLFF